MKIVGAKSYGLFHAEFVSEASQNSCAVYSNKIKIDPKKVVSKQQNSFIHIHKYIINGDEFKLNKIKI